MKIDIVTFDDAYGVTAMYIDGKLFECGDDYHDNIRTLLDGVIKGLEVAKYLTTKVDYEVARWKLDQGHPLVEEFVDSGAEVPQIWPDQVYSMIAEKDA